MCGEKMEKANANMIVHVREAMEVGTGMSEEFGETVTEMMEGMRDVMGSEKANKMLIDMFRGFSSYIDDPEEIDRWYNLQKDLLPEISGLEISVHKFDPDEPGACLYGEFGRYSLEVGIEDKEKFEDIKYYDINVVDSKPGLDGEGVFHSGVVFEKEEINRLTDLVKVEDLEGIIRLINAKSHDHKKRMWVHTPECILIEFIDHAKCGIYTAQVNVRACICGKCNV